MTKFIRPDEVWLRAQAIRQDGSGLTYSSRSTNLCSRQHPGWPLQAMPGRSSMAAAPLSSGTDPILGEIILAGFNFAPQGYALCDGSLLYYFPEYRAVLPLGYNVWRQRHHDFRLARLTGACARSQR